MWRNVMYCKKTVISFVLSTSSVSEFHMFVGTFGGSLVKGVFSSRRVPCADTLSPLPLRVHLKGKGCV